MNAAALTGRWREVPHDMTVWQAMTTGQQVVFTVSMLLALLGAFLLGRGSAWRSVRRDLERMGWFRDGDGRIRKSKR